jgi:hypothetical protein
MCLAMARRQCDNPLPLTGGTMLSSGTRHVSTVQDRGNLDGVWKELTKSGIATLPPHIKRSWTMLDGLTYVAQLRIGRDYRVSRIEHVQPPQDPADRAIQEIRAILVREIGWGHRALECSGPASGTFTERSE